jgi:hypothetical protein
LKQAVVDEGTPAEVAALLTSPEVEVANFPDTWRSLPDKHVLQAAAQGFNWLITWDRNMPHQQHLRELALSVLVLPVAAFPEIDRIRTPVSLALLRPFLGRFVVLDRAGGIIGVPSTHLSGSQGTS